MSGGFKMSRLPTAVERAHYDQEVQRAALEHRDPQWDSLQALVDENFGEENLVWGSQSMKDYGRKGRHDAQGTNPEHDEEHGVKTDGAPTTTYPQTVPDDSEYIAEQVKTREAAKADNSVNADVYDPNRQLGYAIAAGLTAAVADAKGTSDETDNDDPFADADDDDDDDDDEATQ